MPFGKESKGSKRDRARTVFYLLIVMTFAAILLFNLMTPMLTDDFSYGAQARQAGSVRALLLQEYRQYMTWNGRSLVHFLLRCFLVLPPVVFKLCNSAVFVLLTLLLYANVTRRRRYEPGLYLAGVLFLWFTGVDFAQTVLWETGACNYLWGTTIILGFMTVLRRLADAGRERPAERKGKEKARQAALAAGLFFFGVAAGWCNENTSGGALLFVLLLLRRETACGGMGDPVKGRRPRRFVLPPLPLCAAAAGNALGLFLMVSAPGNALRAAYRTEEHGGLFGLLSRFQKVTLRVEKYFFFLLTLLILTIVVSALQKRRESRAELRTLLRERLLFAFLFFMTSYALILTAQTQPRAFFGAGIFLIIACLQGIQDILSGEKERDEHIGVRAVCWSLLSAASLFFVLMYLDNGANMARVWRDSRERTAYILEQKEAGNDEITVGQLHADFRNKFTAAYDGDLTEDPGYWTNVAMAEYYGVRSVSALPYDEWAVSVGRETEEEAAQNNYDEAEENGLFGF